MAEFSTDLAATLGLSCQASGAPRAADVPIAIGPPIASHGRAGVAASVKARLALAKQAYAEAIEEALNELQDNGFELTPVAIQEALDVSRATAYRYLQRRRGEIPGRAR